MLPPPLPARQAGAIAGLLHVQLEDQEGIEPINLVIKSHRLIPTSYWSIIGRRGRCRTFDLSVIGRAHRAAMLHDDGGRRSESNNSSEEGGFTVRLPEPPAFAAHRNWCSYLVLTQDLPLTGRLPFHWTIGAMAECPRFELDALRHNRISNPLQRPC